MNDEKIKALRRKIRTRDNGPAVDTMKKLGINYRVNHGVSLSEIKNIAEQFKYNHELAIELWQHNNREFKIIATHIENPDTVDYLQLTEWIKSLDNTEIAEQISINLLWKVKDTHNYIHEWIKIDNEFSAKAVFVLIAQLAMRNKDLNDDEFEKYFDYFSTFSTTENIFLRKSISLALRKIGRRNINLNKKVIRFVKQFEQNDNLNVKWIAHDVLLEITDETIQNMFN